MSGQLHCWNCRKTADALIEEEVEGVRYLLCGNKLEDIDSEMECRAILRPETKRHCPQCDEHVNVFLIPYGSHFGYWGKQFICAKCGEPSWGIKYIVVEEGKNVKHILLPGSKEYENAARDLKKLRKKAKRM